jgi:two-component system sensor histidine kinase YesM
MRRWYVNLKYRYKLLLTYLTLSIVPLIVLGGFAYITSARYAKRETVTNLEQGLNQAAANVAYKVRAIAGAADTLVRSQRIQQILSRAARGYPERREELDDYHLLVDLLQSIEDYDYVLNARIYIRPEVLYTRENANIFHISQLESLSVLTSSRSQSQWRIGSFEQEFYEDNATSLRLTRTIPDLSSPEPHLAVLQVECRIEILEDTLDAFRRQASTALVVHDRHTVVSGRPGEDLSAERAAAVATDAANTLSTQRRQARPSAVDGYGEAPRAFGRYLVVSADLQDLPWLLSAVVPVAEVTAASRRVTRFTILLAALLIVVDVVAALFFSRTNTQRLDALLKGMRKVTAGEYKQLVTVEGSDEIGELQRQYNQMVTAVNSLIRRVKSVTNKKREAEFKALESQINPHFLYNTLENIKWMAIRHDAPDIVSLVEALSSLYRFTLNRGKEIVTLGEEVESVKQYVAIQNLRFGNRIHADFTVAFNLTGYKITKMILQPLVENAIYHGIHAKEGKRGTVSIEAKAENGSVLIRVADDGIGMPEQQLSSILETESDGYGVKNVHQRLQLYYGSHYGLSYRSSPGAGTTVTVHLPRRP